MYSHSCLSPSLTQRHTQRLVAFHESHLLLTSKMLKPPLTSCQTRYLLYGIKNAHSASAFLAANMQVFVPLFGMSRMHTHPSSRLGLKRKPHSHIGSFLSDRYFEQEGLRSAKFASRNIIPFVRWPVRPCSHDSALLRRTLLQKAGVFTHRPCFD